ncbi:P-loop containing nucleoside triphosphate hydrolase [Lasallia pustulata]|uniref:ATP-dependent DNA helicase n=1 Tax=Lasallia pustulata TaxID=136370 RepID=A0A1W5D6H9_9LECA|nr:P-loop containing nucleoside triphosphate hydrolase [Lasallia pustulata]
MYKSAPNGPGFEDYCRVKMMLHHPFSEPSELRMPNEVGEQTYVAAYRLCQLDHYGQHDTDPLDVKAEEEAEPDEDFTPTQYESEPEEECGPQNPFVELAARRGGEGADRYSQNNARDLGNRPEDLAYDWHSSDYLFERFGEQLDFLTLAKLLPECIRRTRNDPGTLTEAQRVVFNRLYNHCQDQFSGGTPAQLLMHVDGPAGTGKSYLIDMISTYLFDMAEQHGQPDPVLRAAPTGVAAFGIQGQTLHRLIRLPVWKLFEPLSNSVLLRLQQLYQHCHYLIIDEKSMIGLPELYQIDARLKQIFPNRSEEPFGGMNILLCGDFYQLPPVGASPLYDTRPAMKIELTTAKELYQRFDETVRLAQIMRQQGEDNGSIQFRTLLQGLRLGEMADENCQFLQQRVEDNLPLNVRTTFKDSLRIYPTRAAVCDYNFAALRKCGCPVLRIEAKHQPSAAKNSSEEDAQGLYPELLLSKGCRLMITSNLLTAFGLVNGTLGTLYDMALIHSEAARRGALEEHRSIKLSTYGILFMGTPHQGGSGVHLGELMLKVASIFVTADDKILKHLERDSEWLQQQLGQYAPISNDFVTKFAYEMFPTRIALGKAIMIVPQASAVVPGATNAEPVAIPADHLNMVKFASRQNGGYEKVSGHLQLLAEEAPEAIGARWEEQDRIRKAQANVKEDFTVPFSLSGIPETENFVGRKEELAKIKEAFQGDGSQRTIVFLHGLGGIGKTQLAVTFVKEHRDTYSAIF